MVINDSILHLNSAAPVHGLRPAADFLFRSMGERFGENAIGVILTGIGSDGSEGAKAIKARGGKIIVQDEATSIIFGMPRVAIESGVADEILPIGLIAEGMCKIL